MFGFFFFGHQVCGILAHGPGIEPNPPALEGEVLTTGRLGKLLFMCFWSSFKTKQNKTKNWHSALKASALKSDFPGFEFWLSHF